MKRPALVVAPNGFNKRTRDVVLMAILSQPSASDVVALSEADYVDGELPLVSFVKVSKLFTMHRVLGFETVCSIRTARPENVLKELRRSCRQQAHERQIKAATGTSGTHVARVAAPFRRRVHREISDIQYTRLG